MLSIFVVDVCAEPIFISIYQIRHFLSIVGYLIDWKLSILFIQIVQHFLYKLHILLFLSLNNYTICL